MSQADWSWLESQRERVQGMAPEAVAELIGAKLRETDARFAVEVADEMGERRVVISASRARELFDRARELVAAAPRWPRWSFVALRPARGFEFQLQAGATKIDPRALSFEGREGEDGLIIRLMVPNPEFEGWTDIAWELVETCIGEELAGHIAGLEIDEREDGGRVHALEMLGRYVKRRI